MKRVVLCLLIMTGLFFAGCKKENQLCSAENSATNEKNADDKRDCKAPKPTGYAIEPLIPYGPFGTRAIIDVTFDRYYNNSSILAKILTATGETVTLTTPVLSTQQYVQLTEVFGNDKFPLRLISITAKRTSCTVSCAACSLPAVIN